jgi:hypothetical protein
MSKSFIRFTTFLLFLSLSLSLSLSLLGSLHENLSKVFPFPNIYKFSFVLIGLDHDLDKTSCLAAQLPSCPAAQLPSYPAAQLPSSFIPLFIFPLKCQFSKFPGANVIKLFTAVFYCHPMVIPSFCVIKLYYLGNYHGMAVNYCGTVL